MKKYVRGVCRSPLLYAYNFILSNHSMNPRDRDGHLCREPHKYVSDPEVVQDGMMVMLMLVQK